MKRKVTKKTQEIPLKKAHRESNVTEIVKKFNPHLMNPKEFKKIFTELGFSPLEDECGGNCIKCKKKDSCKTYSKITTIFKDGRSD